MNISEIMVIVLFKIEVVFFFFALCLFFEMNWCDVLFFRFHNTMSCLIIFLKSFKQPNGHGTIKITDRVINVNKDFFLIARKQHNAKHSWFFFSHLFFTVRLSSEWIMALEQQAKFPWQWPGSKLSKRPIENDDPQKKKKKKLLSTTITTSLFYGCAILCAHTSALKLTQNDNDRVGMNDTFQRWTQIKTTKMILLPFYRILLAI